MKRSVLILLHFLVTFQVNAQRVAYNNSVQDLITKSTPQAFQFQKYGDLPINLNTGVAEISIPLFSINIKDVSWPISLSYHTGGIKVNELSSQVGLGWTLNAFGMISSRSYQRSDVLMDNEGENSSNKKLFNLTSTSQIHECVYANPTDYWFASNYLDSKENGFIQNYIPDIFYLNLGTSSAKFLLKNHFGYCLPSKDIIIQHIPGANYGSPSNNDPGYWLVIDENGNKYTFEWGGGSATTSEWENNTPDIPGGNPLAYDNYTPTFVLTKIENLFGQKIQFFYTKKYYVYRGNNSDVYQVNAVTQNGFACQNPPDGFLSSQHKAHYNHTIESRLDSINSSDGQSIVFEYSGRDDLPGSDKLNIISEYRRTITDYTLIKKYELNNSYFGSGSDPRDLRLKLTGLTEKGTDNSTGGAYSFEYNNQGLPNRISAAQDYFGYYNGQDNNQNLVPGYGGNRSSSLQYSKGCILEKVNYPTGGYTTLEYELKTYGGLRLKKKVDFSNGTGYNIKKYNYSQIYLATGSTPSLPVYSKELNFYYLYCYPSNCFVPYEFNCPATLTYSEPVMSLYDTYYSLDNTERYGQVEELSGDNGENGKSIYHYGFSSGIPGFIGGEDLLTGKEIFKKTTTGYEIISSESQVYNIMQESRPFFDNSANSREVRIWGLDFERVKPENISNCPCGGGTGYAYCFSAIIMQQSIRYISSPVFLASSIISNYEQATYKEYTYDLNKNLRPSIIRSRDPRANFLIEKNSYCTDFPNLTGTDALSLGVKNLNLKHVISEPIEKLVYRENSGGTGNRLIKAILNQYLGDLPLPSSMYAVEMSSPITSFSPIFASNGALIRDPLYRLEINYQYTPGGNMTTFEKFGDNPISYIYDRVNTLPGFWKESLIASVKHSSATNCAFTSFEHSLNESPSGSGGWLYTGPASLLNGAVGGTNSYSLNGGSISKTGLDVGLTYILSYWSKNGIQNLNISNTSVVKKNVNGWSLVEHIISGSSSLVLSGGGVIDELRLQPQGASIASFCYAPNGSINSTINKNQIASYFEYDGLGRLAVTKDFEKRVLKKFCYTYLGQVENCLNNCTNVIPDWQNTSTSLRCQQSTCGGVTGYQEQEQIDINPCSPTYNTLRWVVSNYNPAICGYPNYNPDWQNTNTPPRCQTGPCGNTGYQEQEQRDLNSCSPSYNSLRWVTGVYNSGSCPVNSITITYQNTTNLAGYVASYTDRITGQVYNFNIPMNGSGSLGCLPPSTYSLLISKPGGNMVLLFGCGCKYVTGTSGNLGKITISPTACNSITIDPAF